MLQENDTSLEHLFALVVQHIELLYDVVDARGHPIDLLHVGQSHLLLVIPQRPNLLVDMQEQAYSGCNDDGDEQRAMHMSVARPIRPTTRGRQRWSCLIVDKRCMESHSCGLTEVPMRKMAADIHKLCYIQLFLRRLNNDDCDWLSIFLLLQYPCKN